MKIGAFGHGLPMGVFAAMGVEITDLTLQPSDPSPAVADMVEPFMDPFAASLLSRLARSELNAFAAIVFLRESPGALPAYLYGKEFVRRGAKTPPVPRLVSFNLIPSRAPGVEAFNRSEVLRLTAFLHDLGLAPNLMPRTSTIQRAGRQSAGRGEDREGPQVALLGSPLGNRSLHDAIGQVGQLAFDQQAEDQAMASAGSDFDSAIAAYVGNPFASRQADELYLAALERELRVRQVTHTVWQVDPHDDLWGWLKPGVAKLCRALGVCFVDLGFLPRWPRSDDLTDVADRILRGGT